MNLTLGSLLPLLVGLIAGSGMFALVRPRRPNPRYASLDWAVFLTAFAFLPVPFVVPFFALSLVPVSYIGIACIHGPYNPLAMTVPCTVLSVVLALVSALMTRLLGRIPGARAIFAVGMLAISLLPIYLFSFENALPQNVIGLFTTKPTHTWGQ